MSPRKIIFDTDPGIDDAMALLFAHAAPQLDLIGITTILGNATIEMTTRNALYIAKRFGIDAPVYMGAASALQVPNDDVPTFVHGDDGLGNINVETPQASLAQTNAAQYIVDAVRAAPGEITIVAVGRLTNLALALQIDPSIAELVHEVIVMGGAVGSNEHTGNVTPVAEANIYGDPHAADIVFQANWPAVMVGLDVTMTCVMTTQHLQSLKSSANEMGEFIWDITRFYENYYRESRGLAGIAVHDSCAVAYAIAPDLFTCETGPLRVATEGITRGHTIHVPSARNFPPNPWDDIPHSKACTKVDSARLLDLYEQTLMDAQH